MTVCLLLSRDLVFASDTYIVKEPVILLAFVEIVEQSRKSITLVPYQSSG